MTRSKIQNIKWGVKLSKCHFIIWPQHPLKTLFYKGYSLLYQNVTRLSFDKVTFWLQSYTSLIFHPPIKMSHRAHYYVMEANLSFALHTYHQFPDPGKTGQRCQTTKSAPLSFTQNQINERKYYE